jgi:MoxR-like ATPase
VADRPLATAIFLALKLQKPLLLEGEAGVGKTEVAKTLAQMLDRRLIRLQCYEGLDVNTTIYEWNYTRQMLQIRLLESSGAASDTSLNEIFGPEFLIKRPLLQAIEDSADGPPILLIDEIDRADEEFEAFLLELLSDWQLSIPEIGTIRAAQPPIVIITSNRTREVHDALKRRCLFYWIDYPSLDKEQRIVAARVQGASELLSHQVVAFVQELRKMDLYKLPGVAETLDWASALVALDTHALSTDAVEDTLGAILKYQDDINQVRGGGVKALLEKVTR